MAAGEFLLSNLLNELNSVNTALPYTVNQSGGSYSRTWGMDFAEWVSTATGTATVTPSGGTNNSDTAPSVDIAEPAASDRGYVSTNTLAPVSGREYVFSIDATNVVDQTTITWTGAEASGTGGLNITAAMGDGRYAVRFVSDGSTGTMRCGPGANTGNPGPGARSCTFANPMFEDVTDTPNSTFCDYTPRYTIVTSHPNNDFASGHSGEVVPGTPVTYAKNDNPYSLGVFVGDSFSNDYTGEWPGKLQATYRGLADGHSANNAALNFGQGASRLMGFGLSGETIVDGEFSISRGLTAELAASTYPYQFAIIQGGVNDINGSTAATAIQSQIESMVAELRAYGVRKIDIMKVAPWENASGWSAANQTQQDIYNAWLDSYAAGNIDIGVIDIYSALGEGGAPQELAAAYDSGDGLHPNGTGHGVIDAAALAIQGPIVPLSGGSWLSPVQMRTLQKRLAREKKDRDARIEKQRRDQQSRRKELEALARGLSD